MLLFACMVRASLARMHGHGSGLARMHGEGWLGAHAWTWVWFGAHAWPQRTKLHSPISDPTACLACMPT
jgi:hypothetical protein